MVRTVARSRRGHGAYRCTVTPRTWCVPLHGHAADMVRTGARSRRGHGAYRCTVTPRTWCVPVHGHAADMVRTGARSRRPTFLFVRPGRHDRVRASGAGMAFTPLPLMALTA